MPRATVRLSVSRLTRRMKGVRLSRWAHSHERMAYIDLLQVDGSRYFINVFTKRGCKGSLAGANPAICNYQLTMLAWASLRCV